MHMEGVVARINLGGFFQKLLTLLSPPSGQVDHRGMEEQMRVLKAWRECFVHLIERLSESASTVQRPRQRIVGRDILPQLEIPVRPFHRRGAILAHIGIKRGKVMKVMYLATLRRLEVSG